MNISNNSVIFTWNVGTKSLHLWCRNGNCVKTFMDHTVNANVRNIPVGFISVHQITDSEKNSVISLFIQMMWIFQLKHRILLDNLAVTHSVKNLHTFVGPECSSVCSQQAPGLGLSWTRWIQCTLKKFTPFSFVLILSSYVCLHLASGALPPDFSTKILCTVHLVCMIHIPLILPPLDLIILISFAHF
jgi:hypothetical protein